MADRSVVTQMSEAVIARLHPAITRWNRLEGRPRTHHFDRALRAEVRDALWFLSRQWQLGEFQGDDAGSPVLARACVDVRTIDRYQAGSGDAEPLGGDEPLEARVERRAVPLRAGDQYLSLDLRLTAGRRWLKLLAREAAAPGGLSADYRAAYASVYGVPVPDPALPEHAAVCAHPDAWQQAGAAAGRAMDGIAVLEHVATGGNAFDGVGAAPADEPKLEALADRLRAWFEELILQPPPEGDDAWRPERLEYAFGVSAPDGDGEIVLRAEEYHHRHLDWYALERGPDEERLGEPPDPPRPPVDPTRILHTFIPTSIVFEGMPDTRWWAFEDRRTNFGDVRPDRTDLGKLLLMEFALVYANDWFVLPFTLDVGTVAEVRGIAVTTVFGERIWVEPLPERSGPEGWEHWSMFTLGTETDEDEPPPARLVLLPVVPKAQKGAALEEAALVRDETANMVWAIEHRVPLPSGRGRPGAEAAHEYRQHLERLAGPPPPGPPPAAPIAYQVINTVPEQWIPFVPVHVEGSVRETQLQRAALPRILPGRPVEKVRPRTTLLRHNLPGTYFVHEEEVPRAGAVVVQSYQRTRWTGGRVFTWFGARKGTGRGEGWSGLKFDRIRSG